MAALRVGSAKGAMNGHTSNGFVSSSSPSSPSYVSSSSLLSSSPSPHAIKQYGVSKEEHVYTHGYFAQLPYRMYDCSPLPVFLSFVMYAITLTIMGISNAMANIRRPLGGEPLRDLAFEYLPHYHTNDLANNLVYGSISCTAVIVIVHPRRRHLVRRLLTMWSIIYLMRATTISVTNLPDPNDMCRNGTLENGIETFFSGLSCGDMIFSGHTVALILNPLILHQAFPAMPLYVGVIMWLYMIAGMWALLATHMHYLVDIEVAVYISFLVYWGYMATVTNEKYLAKFEWLAWWEHDRYYYCTLSQMFQWIQWRWRAVPGSIDPRVGMDPSFDYLVPPDQRTSSSNTDNQSKNNNNTNGIPSAATTATVAAPSALSSSSKPAKSPSPTPPSPSVPSPQPLIKSHDDLTPSSSQSSQSSSLLPMSSSNDSIVRVNGTNGMTSRRAKSKKAG